MQVRPWGLLVYERTEWLITPRKQEHNDKRPLHKLYTGQISEFSRKRLKRAIQLLVAIAQEKEAPNFKTGKMFKFKVNFITLTLPSAQGTISDKDIKRFCLDVWIKRMRRKYKLRSYVWRAEKQFNGNLHFHFITDTWIRFDKIRDDWNECLQHFKFIDEFENKLGHRNPNSTDVHAVWKIRNLTQYFVKYMSKESHAGHTIINPKASPAPSNRIEYKKWLKQWSITVEGPEPRIDGKIWDCSQNLKTKENCEMMFESRAEDNWNQLISQQDVQVKNTEFANLLFLKQEEFNSSLVTEVRHQWDSYLERIRQASRVSTAQTTHGL